MVGGQMYPRSVRMLLALLASALNGKRAVEELFSPAAEQDWRECYKMAAEQGVMAIAWDGVLALPAACQPPRAVKLPWALAVEKYEQRYERYCHTVQELTDTFRPHGIGLMQLKGVGFSACYPVPAHREGGDIDVYLYSLDPLGMTDSEARERGERLMEEQGIGIERTHSKKHNEFYYRNIMIESHKTFLNVYNTPEAKPMEAWLHTQKQPVAAALCGGRYTVSVPGDAFNAVFIGFHAAQHYVHGLSLHHLCDWACMVRRGGLSLLPAEQTDRKVMRFLQAFTALAVQHLGVEAENVPYDGAYAAAIFHEMLYPAFSADAAKALQGNPWRTLIYKTRRFFHRNRKINSVFTISLASRLREVYKNNVKDPARLFRMTGK